MILNPARFLAAAAFLTAVAPPLGATLLPFEIVPAPAQNSPMPQDYGDAAAAVSQPSSDGISEYLYSESGGWTPSIQVSYGSQRADAVPVIATDAEWAGVCVLWSPVFGAGQPIGDPAANAMPSGFEFTFTLSPPAGANRGLVLNGFTLDDRRGHFDSVGHEVQWRVARGTASGPVLASGSATVANGNSVPILTGLAGTDPIADTLVLVIKRLAGTSDDLALDDVDFDEIGFATLSYNTGSLGSAADGLNANGVVLNQPGAVAAGQDFSNGYANSQNTTIPFLEALNPESSAPFTIEFWARPTASDNDDAPVFNRVSDGDRSGWVFFQRDAGTGWNFRMYDGAGSNVGWDLTGGTANLDEWSHVVAVWTGSFGLLYVNGQIADTTNGTDRSGIYNASTSATFSVGAYDSGLSPYNGRVDEIAFYPSALTAAQVLTHFQVAGSSMRGAYAAVVAQDGASLYLQQNPPGVEITLIGGAPTVTFTGVLAQSAALSAWTDLSVTSPYVVPSNGRPASLFFRAHR